MRTFSSFISLHVGFDIRNWSKILGSGAVKQRASFLTCRSSLRCSGGRISPRAFPNHRDLDSCYARCALINYDSLKDRHGNIALAECVPLITESSISHFSSSFPNSSRGLPCGHLRLKTGIRITPFLLKRRLFVCLAASMRSPGGCVAQI